MYQALYRKYRPKTFDDVVGQSTIVKTLKNAIIKNRISHAYLFTGPRGTGKTSIAKIFAELVNCENPKNGIQCGDCVSCTQTINKKNTDIIEIDAASNNGVDEIREIRNKVSLVPSYGRYKIYIIDEVHMLTQGAFNALLKTLEEPPHHAIFILATTEPHKIPLTILSRCQRYDFGRISNEDIVKRLNDISKLEKIDIEEEALHEIAVLSDGGLRDSIGMLDQSISYSEGKIKLDDIDAINGTITKNKVDEFVNLIFSNRLTEILNLLGVYNRNGVNLYKFTEQLINFIENIILSIQAPKYFKIKFNDTKIYEKYSNINIETMVNHINILNDTLNQFQYSNNTKIIFELTLIKMLNNNVNIESDKLNINQTEETNIEIPKKTQISVKNTQTKPIKINDNSLFDKFKKQRINNALSMFDKKILMQDNALLKNIEKHMSDLTYGKQLELLFDSKLKVSSTKNMIFVFDNKNDSEEFNSMIPKIEEALNKYLHINKLIVSTFLDEWNIIKEQFNSKKMTYIYEENIIEENQVYENILQSDNEIQELFDGCIEYN